MVPGVEKYQEALSSGKYTHVVGADEVGYGAFAGPLLVCAAAVSVKWVPPKGLNDSKKVRPAKREELFDLNRDRVPYFCTMAEAEEIDRDGVIKALKRCYLESLQAVLARYPKSLVVLDGEVKIPEVEHLNFPRADGLVPAVMVASVFAKVVRDRLMVELAKHHPGYGFGNHMGYGTPEHQAAITKLGLCPIHRRSYVPGERLKTAEDIRACDDPGMVAD